MVTETLEIKVNRLLHDRAGSTYFTLHAPEGTTNKTALHLKGVRFEHGGCVYQVTELIGKNDVFLVNGLLSVAAKRLVDRQTTKRCEMCGSVVHG